MIIITKVSVSFKQKIPAWHERKVGFAFVHGFNDVLHGVSSELMPSSGSAPFWW